MVGTRNGKKYIVEDRHRGREALVGGSLPGTKRRKKRKKTPPEVAAAPPPQDAPAIAALPPQDGGRLTREERIRLAAEDAKLPRPPGCPLLDFQDTDEDTESDEDGELPRHSKKKVRRKKYRSRRLSSLKTPIPRDLPPLEDKGNVASSDSDSEPHPPRRKTRSDHAKATCLDFGPDRHSVYPNHFFCSECKR